MLLACTWILLPCPLLFAQDSYSSDAQVVVERATHLKNLLDRLLEQSNHSSIQKAFNEGGEASDPLIAEALRLKASGEQYLAEEDYLKAAMTLQAALDSVFQAIRSGEGHEEAESEWNRRLAEAKASNQTFVSAATRLVEGEPNGQATDFLASALRAGAAAESIAADGDLENAIEEFEKSTHLAQQDIMSVRNGKVIERGQ
jgi:tetratricopeptide (TPR) repeat protein